MKVSVANAGSVAQLFNILETAEGASFRRSRPSRVGGAKEMTRSQGGAEH